MKLILYFVCALGIMSAAACTDKKTNVSESETVDTLVVDSLNGDTLINDTMIVDNTVVD